MEDALREENPATLTVDETKVLILVLMEDALRGLFQELYTAIPMS